MSDVKVPRKSRNFIFPHWAPGRGLLFTPQGKHEIAFEQDFPFSLFFLDFTLNYKLTPNYHDYLEILYIYDGSGYFRVGDVEYHVRAGDVLVINNNEFHSIETRAHDHLRVIAVYFLPEFIYSPGGSATDFEFLIPFNYRASTFSHKVPFTLVQSTQMLDLIRFSYQEIEARKPFYRQAVKNMLQSMLLMIMKKVQIDPSSHTPRLRTDIDRLRPVFKHIEQHCSEKIPISALSRIACMSPNYFSTFFRKVTGENGE